MTNILTITLNPALDVWVEAEAVRPTHKTRTSNPTFDAGGGGINVARVIAMLGGVAEAMFLAGGEIGAMLDRVLAEQHIWRTRIAIADQTRISFVVGEHVTNLEYRFVASGPAVQAHEMQSCFDEVSARRAGFVVASGSLPNVAPGDTYARLAEITAAQGGKFVLDSTGAGLKDTLGKAPVYLVKPSLAELEQFVGRKLDDAGIQQAATELVSRGAAEMVAVTMGADGALLATASGVIRLPAIHVRVRSAVGAGDSFLGAMVWALAEGRPAEEAFRLGLAAGAAAAMTRGTRLCQRQDVFDLFAKNSPA